SRVQLLCHVLQDFAFRLVFPGVSHRAVAVDVGIRRVAGVCGQLYRAGTSVLPADAHQLPCVETVDADVGDRDVPPVAEGLSLFFPAFPPLLGRFRAGFDLDGVGLVDAPCFVVDECVGCSGRNVVGVQVGNGEVVDSLGFGCADRYRTDLDPGSGTGPQPRARFQVDGGHPRGEAGNPERVRVGGDHDTAVLGAVVHGELHQGGGAVAGVQVGDGAGAFGAGARAERPHVVPHGDGCDGGVRAVGQQHERARHEAVAPARPRRGPGGFVVTAAVVAGLVPVGADRSGGGLGAAVLAAHDVEGPVAFLVPADAG